MNSQISAQKEENMMAYFSRKEYSSDNVEETLFEGARHYLDMPTYPTFKLAMSAEEKTLLMELDTGELELEAVNAELRLTLNSLDR